MHKGPQASEPLQKQHTPFSQFIGAAIGALGEQGAFHGIDTIAKNGMAYPQGAFPWLKTLVAQHGVTGGFAQLYRGFGLAVGKKVPLRIYKFTFQDYLNESMKSKYGVDATTHFGGYGYVLIQCGAGAISGLVEPVIAQGIDTLQVRKQVLKEAVTWQNIKALGFTGLYRGAVFTGIGRNVPGSIGLFGGSSLANELMNNSHENKDRSQLLNLAAKWFGALTSLIMSQPGDVIKTNMQVKQVSLREAFKAVTVKQLVTGGLVPRLFMSFKVGVGFFLIEESMHYAKELFGKESKMVEPPREPALISAPELECTAMTATPLLTQYDSQKSRVMLTDDEEPTFGAYDDPLLNDLAKQLKRCRM